MKKGLLIILSLIFFINIQAQQKNNSLQEHIDAGKKAYKLYANKKEHKIIKSKKEVSSYNIGDTKTFWRWDLSVMPPAWIQEPATCKAVGEHSYVFVADNQWDVNMNQTDVDEVMFRLEDETLNSSEYGIVEMDTIYFGAIPDELDGDPKVIFFFSALGSFGGAVFDGYFSSFNQMTEDEAQNVLPPEGPAHSNECEMLYMSCAPVNPTAAVTLSVLAHELQHLIHWGYDTNEASWVDEGCAELAMVLYGQPDPIVSFPTNPNNNLTVWDQQFSDYVQVMLFFTYLSEQYGSEIIKAIVANTENSVVGINTVLSNNGITDTFTEIFNNWTIANFIDDLNFETGLYGYENLDLPNFSYSSSYTNFPINTSKSIDDCAAVYYKIPINFTEAKIQISSNNEENSRFHLLAFEGENIREVIPNDENLEVIFSQPNNYTLSRLVLLVANQRVGTSSTNFTINVFDPTIGINTLTKTNISMYSNIVKDIATITYNFNKNENLTVEVVDINGKLIKNVFSGLSNSGKQSLTFNVGNISSGMYLLNIKTANTTKVLKLFVE